MYTITDISSGETYPTAHSAYLVPSGYRDCPTAFDTTAVDILNYLKASEFDIQILADPDNFRTLELNSNLKRLGKYAVSSVVLPLLINVLSCYIYDEIKTPTVDSEPVRFSLCIQTCDSNDMQVRKEIKFEGTAEEFNEMKEGIKDLLTNGSGI